MLKRMIVASAILLTAGGTHAGDIHVEQARARASVANQPNGAAFLMIENKGKTDDALLSATAPVAGKVEIHSMTMEGDVMKMRAVERIDLKPGEKIEMKPGDGYHIMLMGLKKPLKAGDSFPMQLNFRKAGKVQIKVEIADISATPHSESGHDTHEHHHH